MRKGEGGFTLVELLVALVIFGMLTAAGVALLSFAVRTQDVADGRNADLAALRRTSLLLGADLAQAVPRPSRDEAGALHPALEANGAVLLGLVRRGWTNHGGAARPSLQKVQYRLSGGRLERAPFRHVDGAAPLPATPLIEDVTAARLRFRDPAGEWRDQWDPTDPTRLPRAVELTLTTRAHGELRQLFLVGA